MTTVRIEDSRKVRYCSRGMRALADRYGYSYIDFVRNGIDADHLRTLTNRDHMAEEVIKIAEEREANDGR